MNWLEMNDDNEHRKISHLNNNRWFVWNVVGCVEITIAQSKTVDETLKKVIKILSHNYLWLILGLSKLRMDHRRQNVNERMKIKEGDIFNVSSIVIKLFTSMGFLFLESKCKMVS